MLVSVNAVNELSRLGLDCNKTYFLFCGSFADKWFIASILPEVLRTNQKCLIISDKNDLRLLQIFIGESISRVLTCDSNTIEYLRNICRQDQCCYMPCTSQLSREGEMQSPPGIRSLHLVDYPYLTHMSVRYCASYIDMLRLICFLPIDAVPSQPLHLSDADRSDAEQLLLATGNNINKIVVFNIVNYSHASLTDIQRTRLITAISESQYCPIINVAGMGDNDISALRQTYPGISTISIPGHLVKSVFDLVPAVIGVIGGAISIADIFSSCSILTFATRSNFFPGYTSALRQDVNFLEFVDLKPEPRPVKARIVNCINLPNHEDVSSDVVAAYIARFLREVSEL